MLHVKIFALLLLLLCLLLLYGLQQSLLLFHHNLKLVILILLFRSSLFISISMSWRFIRSLSHFSFKNSTASLPLLLFLLSFMSPPLSSWFFRYFVCLILSIACFFFSSNFIILFLFSYAALPLFSAAAAAFRDLFQENTQPIPFRRYSRCLCFFPFFLFVPSLKKGKSLPDCSL